MIYIDVEEILFGFIRVLGEGNWMLHLRSNRRYHGCSHMMDLTMQNTHQYTIIRCKTYLWNIQKYYEHLKNVGSSVQLGMANTFGCIPVDQAIRETANKDIV